MSVVLWILAALLVCVGIAGIILPALPGTILIFAGLMLAAWADGFMRVGPITLVVIGLIGAATYGIDFLAAALGAQRLGASRAMIGAGLGTVLGLFIGLPGIILGPFVGAVVGELSVRGDWRQAGRAGLAAWIGFVVGAAAKVAMAFLMVGIFLLALAF